MAKDNTRKRIRKRLVKELRRQLERRDAPGSGRPSTPYRMPPRRIEREWEDDPGDDLDGGAGVREPRRPRPTMPVAALELDEPELRYLDLTDEGSDRSAAQRVAAR